MNDRAPLSAPTRPTPLWGIYAFSFLNSIGTGVGTSGIYFLTTQGYGFSQAQNYLLGIVLGVTYIIGALATAPLLRLLHARGISSRGLLVGLMIVMASTARPSRRWSSTRSAAPSSPSPSRPRVSVTAARPCCRTRDLTGGQVVSEEVGLELDSTGLELLGSARKVVITKDGPPSSRVPATPTRSPAG